MLQKCVSLLDGTSGHTGVLSPSLTKLALTAHVVSSPAYSIALAIRGGKVAILSLKKEPDTAGYTYTLLATGTMTNQLNLFGTGGSRTSVGVKFVATTRQGTQSSTSPTTTPKKRMTGIYSVRPKRTLMRNRKLNPLKLRDTESS